MADETPMDQWSSRIISLLQDEQIPQRHTDHPDYYITHVELGRGSFGRVRLAYRHMGNGLWKRAAIKQIPLGSRMASNANIMTVRESAKEVALRELMGPCTQVMPVYGLWLHATRKMLEIPMDVADMNLETYAKERQQFAYSPHVLYHIVVQCLMALAHLHRSGVVHRDVKPVNFLVNLRDGVEEPPVVRISDFGLSCRADAHGSSGELIGTSSFMAPEVLIPTARSLLFPYARDIWSLGCVTYFLVTGELPFRGRSVRELLAAVQQGIPRTSAAQQRPRTDESDYFFVIATMMLDPRYDQRPTARELLALLQADAVHGRAAPFLPSSVISSTEHQRHLDVSPVYRCMYLCRPFKALPLYTAPNLQAPLLTDQRLKAGDLLIVAAPTHDDGENGDDSNNTEVRTSSDQRRHRPLKSAPRRSPSSSASPSSIALSQWVRVVYPWAGYCQCYENGYHLLHEKVVDPQGWTTHRLCPATPSLSAMGVAMVQRRASASLQLHLGDAVLAGQPSTMPAAVVERQRGQTPSPLRRSAAAAAAFCGRMSSPLPRDPRGGSVGRNGNDMDAEDNDSGNGRRSVASLGSSPRRRSLLRRFMEKLPHWWD